MLFNVSDAVLGTAVMAKWQDGSAHKFRAGLVYTATCRLEKRRDRSSQNILDSPCPNVGKAHSKTMEDLAAF